MPARIGWIIRDNTSATPEEYNWVINPNEFSLPHSKTITYSATAAADGRSLVFEGRDEVQKIGFSGVVLSQEQYEELVGWFNKRTQLELEDDLGRTFQIYITSFNTSRVRSTQYPWRHKYDGEMIVLDWAE